MVDTWSSVLCEEKKSINFKNILRFISNERNQGKIILPNYNEVFNAFFYCSLSSLKVVILGQDPYYKINQAHGLAFSVRKGIVIPPSLCNIYRELVNTCNISMPKHGCLIDWAVQGVLLLNSILTVELNKPGAHANIGWDCFTNKVIQKISYFKNHIVFLLWGSYAHKKQSFIFNKSNHLILKASHPSPLSAYRGFFGCNHFALTNQYLKYCNIPIIDWNIK